MAIKLFFFDLEGTLVEGGSDEASSGMWYRVVQELGPEAAKEEAELYKQWKEGRMRGYCDWCEKSLSVHKRYGLTRERFEHLLDTSKTSKGAEEVVSELHKRGVVTVIISGGFMAQAAQLQQNLKISHALAAVDYYWDDEGRIAHWNILPADYEGKVDFVELLRREYGFNREECAFVGNGRNDALIAAHVGLSFAYNAHPDLQKAATHSITDLREILKYL